MKKFRRAAAVSLAVFSIFISSVVGATGTRPTSCAGNGASPSYGCDSSGTATAAEMGNGQYVYADLVTNQNLNHVHVWQRGTAGDTFEVQVTNVNGYSLFLQTFNTTSTMTEQVISLGGVLGSQVWVRNRGANPLFVGDMIIDNTPITPPGVPGGLTADTHAAGQITLTWTASNPSASGYKVLRDSVQVADVTTTEYVDTGMTTGTNHTYRVQAYNPDGGKADSAPVVAYWPNVPAAPTNLTASSEAKPVLTWTAPALINAGDAPTAYHVYRDGVLLGGNTATTYTDTTATVGTAYTYIVKAINAAGTSPNSNTVTVTPSVAAPGIATGVTADAHAEGKITVTWTAPATAPLGYRVLRDSVQVADVTTTEYVDTTMTTGANHTYVIRSYNAEGGTADSSPVTAYWPNVLTAPTGLTITNGVAPVLNWTAPALVDPKDAPTTYQVYRDGVLLLGVSGTTYTDNACAPDTSYTYTVKAYNAAGPSPASAAATVKTPVAQKAPAAPKLLPLVKDINKVHLKWDPSPGATVYKVMRDGTKIAETSALEYTDTVPVMAFNGGGSLAMVAAAPAAPTYTVVASNPVGDSPPSNAVSGAAYADSGLGWTMTTSGIGGYVQWLINGFAAVLLLVLSLVVAPRLIIWGIELISAWRRKKEWEYDLKHNPTWVELKQQWDSRK